MRKLTRSLLAGLLLGGLALSAPADARAGVPLAKGDLAVMGFVSDDALEGFALVALADIPGNSVIFITDDGWEGGAGFGQDLNDWHMKWTVDGDGVPAGTVLGKTTGGDTFATQGTVAFESGGNLVTSINLNSDGDCILVYQTSDDMVDFSGANVTFISGFNNNSFGQVNGWNPTSTATTSSFPPAGLTAPTTNGGAGEANGRFGVTEAHDNYSYNSPTTAATKAQWLARLNTPSNWDGEGGGIGGSGFDILPDGDLPATVTVTLPDVTPPTFTSITRQTPATSPTNADSLVFRASFNEDVQNVDATDFAVSGSTAGVTGVATVSASSYDVTVSGGNLAGLNGTVGLNLAGGQNIQDLAGNALGAGEPATDQTYAIDNTAPTVAISAPSQSPVLTGAGTVTYTVTYTGADSVTLAMGDITLNQTGTANGSVAVSGSGTSTRTVTISSITGDGTLGITLASGTASDDAGNNAAAAGPSSTFTVDPLPVLSIAATSANKAEGNSGNTAFTFTVSRTGNASGASSATYAVAGSGASAANAADFGGTLPSGSVNFAANETSKVVTVNASGDTDFEANEGFTITLSSPSGATLGTATANGTIQNDEAVDLGDAPTAAQSGLASDYPTTAANNGAWHELTGPTLGATRDGEGDGQPTLDADGDDMAGGDDEDGVTFSTLNPGVAASATVNVQGGAARLDAWIDWNRNGIWGDSIIEQIADDVAVSVGDNTVNFTVPISMTVGDIYTRFRISSAGNLAPTGGAADGEVEDHKTAVTPPGGGGGATDNDVVNLASGINVIIRLSGGNLEVVDNGSTVYSKAFGMVLSLMVNGNASANNVDVQFTGGAPLPPGGLFVNLGPDTGDSMLWDFTQTFNYLPSGPAAGTIDFTGQGQLHFSGLDPLFALSGVNDVVITIDPLNTFVGAITTTVKPGTVAGRTLVEFSAGLESIEFVNPMNSLTIVGDGNDDDIFVILGVDPAFSANLIFQGGVMGVDRVELNGDINIGSGSFTATSGIEQIHLDADIQTDGGSVSLTAGTEIKIEDAAGSGNLVTIDTESGDDSNAGAITIVGALDGDATGRDLSLDASSGGGNGGAIGVPALNTGNKLNDVAILAAGTGTDGIVTLGGNVDVDNPGGDAASLIVSGALRLGASRLLDASHGGGPAGSVDLRNAEVSATGAGVDLTINAQQLVPGVGGGLTGGAVDLGVFNAAAGSAVNALGVNTSTAAVAIGSAGDVTLHGSIQTTATQTYTGNGPAGLEGGVILASSSTLTASTVTFNNDIDGMAGTEGLTITGNLAFGNDANDQIGAGTALASLSVSGTATFASTSVTTTVTTGGAGQTYNIVVLNENTTFNVGAGAVSLNNSVDSQAAENNSLGITGAANIGNGGADAIGAGQPLSSLSVSGATTFNSTATTEVTTTGTQTYGAIAASTDVNLSSTGGTINFNGAAAPSANVNLAASAATISVGGSGSIAASGTGDITLTSDSVALAGGLSGADQLTIRPATATTMGLGGGAGTLNLTDAEIALLANGFAGITLGRASTTTTVIDTASFADPVTIFGATAIQDAAGTDINAGANNVSLQGNVTPGTSPGILTITGNLVLDATDTVTMEFGAGSPVAGTTHDQINVTGTVTLGNAALSLSGAGQALASTEAVVLIANDGVDAVSGTFNGLAEGASVSQGNFHGHITYLHPAGAGNDVALIPATVSLAVANTPKAENAGGTIDYTFTRSGPTTAEITVNFNVSGTAKLSDTDHAASAPIANALTFSDAMGTVKILAGASTAVVSIDPTGDNKVELNETVILTTQNGTGYKVAASPANTRTGAINNDDQAVVSIAAAAAGGVAEAHAGEANPTLTYNISISNPVDVPVNVNIRTTDAGEAKAATTDFTSFGNTLKTFPTASTTDLTQGVTIIADDIDERQNGDQESLIAELNTIGAMGRNVVFTGGGTAPITATGQINNDDFDVQITALTDSADPTEHGENFTVTLTVATKVVGGATTPATPMTANSLRVREGATTFGAQGAPPTITPMASLLGTLRNATLIGEYDGIKNMGGLNFNPTNSTITHVVNNIPVFVRRTGALTVNGALQTYNGPNIAVQSGSMPVAFTIGDLIEQINPDRGTDGSPPPANAENAQTVSFTLTPTINAGGPLFAVAPAVAMQTTGYDQIEDLTFTTLPNAAGIATITITATDNGVGGLGTQTTASQTFCISVYGTQPFLGDLAIADRGARVYTGALSLVHTNAGSMAFPTQNMINNTIVDAYELTVVTNAPMAGPLAGKKFLEYVVIDYETILSAKGRGEQGLFGVNSVSQTKRTISTGQNFAVPLGVDLLPFEAGPANRGKFVVADAEIEPNLSKIILVDPTLPAGANQSVLTAGGELFFTTGITVAPEGSPNAGDIYVTDVGNVFGKTVNKNDNPRKIVKINPTTGVQTLLISEINDFAIPITNGMITNLYHPTGIDVDPVSGDLYIADSFSKTVWQLPSTGPGTFAAMLTAFSVDADFIQPVHLAVANGGQFIYLTDGATVPPNSAYAANTRFIHKIDRAVMDATANSTIFTQDGLLEEPRGIEIIPPDPLTGP